MKMLLNDFYFFLRSFIESVRPKRSLVFSGEQIVVVINILIHIVLMKKQN